MPAPLLAARLTELRQSKGLSQKDIADYLGITREAYSHYERSTREPNLEVICKLTKLYHIEVSELINERTILAASNPKSDNTISASTAGDSLSPQRSNSADSRIVDNMNHLLKLFSGKHSHLDLTEITKEDIDILAIYRALDDQTQKEIRDFIKFKQSQIKR